MLPPNRFLAFCLLIPLCLVQCQSNIRGPPQSKEKVVVKVGNIGETVRLQCPIVGHPPPFFEWKKDGHPIDDITWIRYRKNKNFLKIRNANRDDTGIYVCKGINGFGSDEARIEVVVVDPVKYPPQRLPGEEVGSGSVGVGGVGVVGGGGDRWEVAPPVFTAETRQAKLHRRKDVGDTFTASCEALGSPRPSLRWLKDGQEIRDSVLPRRRGHAHLDHAPFSGVPGRSTVEFQVMGSADAGVYTCQASNGVGGIVREINFTLAVTPNPASARHAVVTEAGPGNSSVVEGDKAVFKCRVKAVELPHIKWLKKLEGGDDSASASADQFFKSDFAEDGVLNAYTLNLGSERYRVLASDPDVQTGEEEYTNKLVIPRTRLSDAGLYICFVTNSGFGALTYKSAVLRVVSAEAAQRERDVAVSREAASRRDNLVLILVVFLVSLTFFVVLGVVFYVIRRSRLKSPSSASSSSTMTTVGGKAGQARRAAATAVPGYDDLDADNIQQRPFLMDVKYDRSPASLPPPPPSLFPSAPSSSIGQWSRTVYPTYGHIQPHYENPSAPAAAGSGVKYLGRESPAGGANQYEVPYSHLKASRSVSGSSSFHPRPGAGGPRHHTIQQQQQQQAGSTPAFRYPPQGGSGTNPLFKDRIAPESGSVVGNKSADSYPIRNYQYFQYLGGGDYEA